MADVDRFVKIVFGGVDDTGKAFSSINSGLSSLDDSIGQLSQPFADITYSIIAFDTALAAAGATMVAFAISKAGQFTDATAEINTLISATADEFGSFENDILDYASGSTAAISEINGSLYSLISAGNDYSDSLEVLASAEKLSIAGKADLNATSVLLASTLNAYGESVDQASRYSDVFFNTVKLGQTTLPELAASLAGVTGVASAAGVPIEQITAAIAELTSKGLPTSEAITAIKSALSNVIKPSKDASDAAKELGIQFDVEALKTKGLNGLLAELDEVTGGNVATMSRFFGSVEGLNGALVLSSDGAADFTDKIGAMENAAGATDEAFEKMRKNVTLVMQGLVNNLDILLIKTGIPLLDEFADGAKGLEDIFKGLTVGIKSDAFAPVYAVLETFLANVAQSLREIGENIGAAFDYVDFTGLANALTELGGSIKESLVDVFGEIDTSKPETLAVAIQKVVNLLTTLTNVTNGIVAGFSPVFEAIGKASAEISGIDKETSDSIGNFLSVMTMLNGFGVALTGALFAFKEFQIGLGGGIDILAGSFRFLWNSAQVAFDGLAALIIGTLAGIAKALESITPDFLGDPWGDIANDLDGLARGAVENLKVNAQETNDALSQLTDGFKKLGSSSVDLKPLEQATKDVADSSKALSTEIRTAKQVYGNMDFQAVADGFYRIEYNADGTREAVKLTNEQLKEIEETVRNFHRGADDAAKTFNELSNSLTDTKTQGDYVVKTFTDLNGNIKLVWENASKTKAKTDEFNTSLVSGATSADDLSKKLNLTAKESAELYVQLKKLADDKDIKLIEAKVQLNIAELEAQTKIVEATFESINTTITSTGDLIGSLFGSLTDAGSLRDKFAIEDQIEEENKRRDKALKQQAELTKAQIKYLQERANALSRGDSLITIDGGDLQYELEAFMWKILEKIQIRATAEGEEFLLNVTP